MAMLPKEVTDLEARISEMLGTKCWFEYSRWDGAKRLEDGKPSDVYDGLLKDLLDIMPGRYHNDHLICLKKEVSVDYNGRSDYGIVASMRLYQLPGCCGVAVSSGSTVVEKYRRKGLNTILNKFRMELAKHMGYTVLLCSDLHSNEASKKTLAKNGWKDIYQFKNKRTNNVIDIAAINLE